MNLCLMGTLTFSEMQLSCCKCGKYLRHAHPPLIGSSVLRAVRTDEFAYRLSKSKFESVFLLYVKPTVQIQT